MSAPPASPRRGGAGTDRHGRSAAQWFCLVGGTLLLLRGGIGVLLDPVFESPGEGWHQLIHMSSGAILLVACRGAAPALAAALAFGVFYAGVAVIGFVDGAEVAGIIPVQSADNGLHTILTLSALGTGLASLRRHPNPLEPS